MPQGERALQVDEVSQRDKKGVQPLFIEPVVAIGCLTQRRGPSVTGGRPRQDGVGMLDERVDALWVELATPPAAGYGHGPVDAVGTMVHLDHVGELSDPHLYRDLVTVRAAGQTAAVVSLESERERR